MKKILSVFVLLALAAGVTFAQNTKVYNLRGEQQVFKSGGVLNLMSGSVMYQAGSKAETPDTTYSAVQVSTSLSPVGVSFMVINATGTITLTSTPHISTTTAISGQVLTIMGGSNPVTFVDEGTLTGSLLELGAATRTLGAGDMLRLRYYAGKWYEELFANN